MGYMLANINFRNSGDTHFTYKFAPRNYNYILAPEELCNNYNYKFAPQSSPSSLRAAKRTICTHKIDGFASSPYSIIENVTATYKHNIWRCFCV